MMTVLEWKVEILRTRREIEMETGEEMWLMKGNDVVHVTVDAGGHED